MEMFGLHVVDWGIILLYVVVILYLGRRVGKAMKSTSDFFLAGRKLGKFYQFFLNFGQATDAQQAVVVSREIYRQGLGGMWLQFLVLFLTPFYWFTTLLFRRSRLMTIGDYFAERFRSPFLGGAYAFFGLFMAFIGTGTSYMAAEKTMEALTKKPLNQCTEEERASVEGFREYKELKARVDEGLDADDQARYGELSERLKRKELHAYVSYTNQTVFFIIYALIVAIYTAMGGFTAVALTDAIQGVLIVTFSLILIPIGLGRIGGFEGLHAKVPDYMFELFGSASTSEYTWYSILAMITANLVSIVAASHMMATAGSAKDEMTARVGMLGGMFFKRFIMLAWALAGLLALGLFAGSLDDPDHIWGHMTQQLLCPGAIGLMLAGVLAANMSSLDAQSVCSSALFIRNLYQPWRPRRTERHYINVGRGVIVVTLIAGIGMAYKAEDLAELFKYFISLPAVFGAAVWLGFIWRRLTRWAVIIQVIVCFTIYAVIPNVFSSLDSVSHNPSFLDETQAREVTITTGALVEDVAEGRATHIGQSIEKRQAIEPTGIFFDKVVRADPADPDSAKIGQGRFHAEIWILSWLGVDFAHCTKAQLVATRFFFDALFPFVLLFALSFLTRPVNRQSLDAFFGKMHTPVHPTPEEEAAALEHAAHHPEIFESKKLFPGTNWEILKPGWKDAIGFGGSWVIVGVVILLLWVIANIGA